MATLLKKRVLCKIEGVARWLTIVPDGDMLDCGAGHLEIQVRNTTGPVTETYWCQRIKDAAGKVVGYRLTKDSTGETRDVDVSFGGSWKHWSCSCPDFKKNRRYRPVGEQVCKHIKAIGHALVHIGLL